jgi:hypothetical protein
MAFQLEPVGGGGAAPPPPRAPRHTGARWSRSGSFARPATTPATAITGDPWSATSRSTTGSVTTACTGLQDFSHAEVVFVFDRAAEPLP